MSLGEEERWERGRKSSTRQRTAELLPFHLGLCCSDASSVQPCCRMTRQYQQRERERESVVRAREKAAEMTGVHKM